MLATLTLEPRRKTRVPARFTLDGSAALEKHLATICREVSAGCRRIIPESRLEGVVLGGGYGRGEGGVLKTPRGDRPYNDLEFYVFVRGHPWLNERRFAKALHELSSELGPTADLEIEFKITSSESLRRSSPSLFYHDLLMGHRWILGDESLFDGCDHHRSARRLPLSEAIRLLMNRCSGLLFALEKLEGELFGNEEADFVRRNIAKVDLALGDAVLIAFHRYHWSCRVRGERLNALSSTEELPWLADVKECHCAGIEFKLRPISSRASRESLRAHFDAVHALALKVWLWLERQRLGCEFDSIADYAASLINKWPGGQLWRNRLANLKVFGPRALLAPGGTRHPRHRILNALALSLWARGATEQVQSELLAPIHPPAILTYRERWQRAS